MTTEALWRRMNQKHITPQMRKETWLANRDKEYKQLSEEWEMLQEDLGLRESVRRNITDYISAFIQGGLTHVAYKQTADILGYTQTDRDLNEIAEGEEENDNEPIE